MKSKFSKTGLSMRALLFLGLIMALAMPTQSAKADYATFDNPDYYYANITNAPDGTKYRQAGISPDGTQIVAVKQVGTSWEIYLMNADGSGETIISAGDSGTGDIAQYTNPFWSDDGTAIGFAEVHNANPNKIIRYDITSSTRSYIYEPIAPADAANPDFLGTSTTSIIFWDRATGGADLFTWDGSTLTNITNTTGVLEYEPISNADGTKIVYWEAVTEPTNSTHTLTNVGGTWTKDVGFTPIAGTYWAYWTTPAATQIALTTLVDYSGTLDIHLVDNAGNFVSDLTGPGYTGGAGQWNFTGTMPQGPGGEFVFTSNAGRANPAVGRDIIIAAPRAEMYVDDSGSDSNPGTEAAPFATIQKAVNEAADGGTVHVEDGTYTEQVTITKSLDLIGDGEGTTTILAPAVRAGSVTQGSTVHDYLLAAYAASGTIDVRVEGFTLDVNAQNKTAGTARLDGVFFRDIKDAGGTVAGLFSSTIHNFAATPDYESWGLAVYGDSLLTLNDNDLSDYTRDGIVVVGGNVTISNNTVTGSATPLNGINIQDVTAGSVTGNTVTGHTRSTPWAAGGIVAWTSTGLTISGNHVNGNFYAIDLLDGSDNNTVSNNELTDNIKRGITLDNSDDNTVSGNTITGPVGGTDDVGIGVVNTSTGNTIGGTTLPAGNTISMATSGSANLYAIHMQSDAGADNTIRYNTLTGGKRAVQFDGPPGITGLTTVSDNVISGPSFGGIVAYNNGDLVITNNSLTGAVRPMEFFGPVNLTITGNTINGSTYAGINLGAFSGTATLSGNTIYNIATDQNGIWAQTSGAGLDITGNTIHDISGTGAGGGRGIQIDPAADNVNIDGNELYNITGFSAVCIDTGATGTLINNNYIHNNAQGIAANEQTAQFDGNRILNNRWGIDLNSSGATFTLLHNQIAGNNTNPADSYGLGVWAGTATVEENWWGAVSGPAGVGLGTGDIINVGGGTVDYSPWCMNAACTTFAPPFSTLTTITADTPDPSLLNQTVTVTATVEGLPAGALTPTGTVTISGGVADCTITLVGGSGSCGITFNTTGAKTITATYNPDTADFTGSSDTESHNTLPYNTLTTITSDTPDPSLLNQTVTVTAKVKGLPAGAPTPTGTVTISGGVADCTISLVSGSGSCGISFNTGGAKTITATYNPVTADFITSGDTESHKITLIKSYTSQGLNDGLIIESSEISGVGGGALAPLLTSLWVGDTNADWQIRSILSFDTSTLPENAVITKVTLKIKKQGLVGANPFLTLGNLLVDIRRPYFGATVALALNDFQAATSRAAVGFFGTTPVGNWYSAGIPKKGYPFINLTGTTQFRLRFAIDDNNNNIADYMKFYSGDYSSVNARPTLIIEYQIP